MSSSSPLVSVKAVFRFLPRKRSGVRSASGFSLIELLVVIAMLAILVTIGVSTLSSPKRGQEISQAGSVLGDLAALARQHSLAKNTRTVLVVGDVNRGDGVRTVAGIWDAVTTNQLERWNVLPDTVKADSSGAAGAPLSGVKYQGATLSQPATYWFYPDGRMGDDADQIPKLKVQGRQGAQVGSVELIFNPVTGTFKSSRGGES